MTEPDPHHYSDDELSLLASLRGVRPEDAQLDQPPVEVWAGIERSLAEPPDSVDQPAARRRSRRPWWIAIAAVVAVVMVGVSQVVLRRGDEPTTFVAAAELTSDGLDGAPTGLRGEAEVVESNAGEVLRLDLGQLRPASGEYLEVWLMKPDISGMVSLGTVRPDGTYEVPVGLSLAMYSLIDVSSEPYDGDPTHSGASLLRGQLKV